MKRKLVFLIIPIIFIVFALNIQQKENEYTGISYSQDAGVLFSHLQYEKNKQKKEKGNKEKKVEMTVEIANRFLSRVNHPYGKNLPMEIQLQINEEMERMPKEPVTDNDALDQWKLRGPWGGSMRWDTTVKFSGRMRDVEPIGSSPANTVRFAAATGGLWRYVLPGNIPTSFGDKLPTQNMGSFCTNPTDENTVFAGTGECENPNGLGLYKTTNLGATWTPITMSPTPSSFYKIRYQPGNQNIMHAATINGYYRSTNAGTTWTRTINNNFVTDFAINPSNTNEIWSAIGSNNSICGLYKSTNNGVNWSRVTTSPLPTTNVMDIKIALSPSNPQIIYFSASRWDNAHTLGYYKTTNGGTSWTSIVPAAPNFDIHGGQGGYNDAICISPTNPNIVFVGGVDLIRTTNGGTTWQNAGQIGVNWHPDQHMLRYNSAGTVLYSCSDGGIFASITNGSFWSSSNNNVPITQFYSIATPMNQKAAFIGGTQDNGTMVTTNGAASTWYNGTGGDGAGSAIDPLNTNICLSFTWYYGGYNMYRNKSYDAMLNSVGFNTGIPPNTYWWGLIRHDKVSPVLLYTNSGPYIYYATSPSSSWIQMNSTAFPYEVWAMDVAKFGGSSAVVYAGLHNPTPNSTAKLRVFDNSSTWFERSTGLPAGTNIWSIPQHPTNNNIAFVCMEGYSSAGQKIFKTTNRGINWVNITGNLPNISMTGLVPHPTNANLMVAGSFGGGIYKTTNGGSSWFQWMNGMPNVIYVNEMTWVDSTSINGKFYVVANSFGRSVWTRDMTGDDPPTGIVNQNNTPNEFRLNQNFPNPFNPVTTISFDIPRPSRVKIVIFDIRGREVQTLIDENKTAGSYRIQWDGAMYSSGVYFYKIEAGDFKETKKMIFIK